MTAIAKKKTVKKTLLSSEVSKSRASIKIQDKKVETKVIPTNSNPIEEAKAIIEKILELADLEAKVIIKNADTIEASGKDSAIIIGRNGSTLFAIDTLLNSILNKNRVNKIKIVFDVEEYRQRYPNKTITTRKPTDQPPLQQPLNQIPANPYTRNSYDPNNSYNKKLPSPYSTTNYNYYTRQPKRTSVNHTYDQYKPFVSPYRQSNNGKYNKQ